MHVPTPAAAALLLLLAAAASALPAEGTGTAGAPTSPSQATTVVPAAPTGATVSSSPSGPGGDLDVGDDDDDDDGRWNATGAAAPGGLHGHAPAAGGFLTSCEWSGFSVSGTAVIDLCKDAAGFMQLTSIELDDCLGNKNGVLVWPGNHFKETCSSFAFKGNNFCATCRTTSGGNAGTQCIGLNSFIANTNGVLTC